MAFDGDKDAFCKAYKKNADGMAERIQREVNMDAFRQEQHHAAELQRRDAEIKSCDAEIERLKALLDRELEWKPYEFTQNISQACFSSWCYPFYPRDLRGGPYMLNRRRDGSGRSRLPTAMHRSRR